MDTKKLSWQGKLPLLFRWKGSVFLKVWPQTIGGILYTTALVAIHSYLPGITIDFPISLISVLGVVIGLLLVFRTNTAYDRYWEGRKIWSNMTNYIRTLTRSIWLGVKDKKDPNDPTILIEKISAINLLIGFAFAVKNYLREEYSHEHDADIQEHTSHLLLTKTVRPSKSPESENVLKLEPEPDLEPVKETPEGKQYLSVSISIPEDPYGKDDKKPKQRLTMSTRRRSAADKPFEAIDKDKDSRIRAHDFITPTNIPLDIVYYMSSYIYDIMAREIVDGTTMFVLMGTLNNLTDCLTQFERILRTPIPMAYTIHLHQSIWIYLLSVPFQLIGNLGWFTVPAMGIAWFALLGMLEIGSEIENPFGYDDNDLPLDDFCEVLKDEIQTIIGHRVPSPESWTFSPNNHPFYPTSYLTASELNTKSYDELRTILASGSAYRQNSTSYINNGFNN